MQGRLRRQGNGRGAGVGSETGTAAGEETGAGSEAAAVVEAAAEAAVAKVDAATTKVALILSGKGGDNSLVGAVSGMDSSGKRRAGRDSRSGRGSKQSLYSQ